MPGHKTAGRKTEYNVGGIRGIRAWWNFKHIANATMRSKIERACTAEGYHPPTICTPEELLEPQTDV